MFLTSIWLGCHPPCHWYHQHHTECCHLHHQCEVLVVVYAILLRVAFIH